MGFSRQKYWSGLPFPSAGDCLDPGIKPRSPALQADALPSKLPGKPNCQFNHLVRYSHALQEANSLRKDNADSGVQFITPAVPRQSLLLTKDPDQHL